MLLAKESPLSAAHRLKRKAEMLVKYLNFREAIECHKGATILLNKALANTSNKQVIESLRAQVGFHDGQIELLIRKEKVLQEKLVALEAHKQEQRKQLGQEQVAPIAAISEQYRTINSSSNTDLSSPQRRSESPKNCPNPLLTDTELCKRLADCDLMNFSQDFEDATRIEAPPKLETEIIRVIGEYDSLLQILDRRREQSASEGVTSDDGSRTGLEDSTPSSSPAHLRGNKMYKSGYKKPKDDKSTIEELRQNNGQLRDLVEQLVGEMERVKCENTRLKGDLKEAHREVSSLRTKLMDKQRDEPLGISLGGQVTRPDNQLILQPFHLASAQYGARLGRSGGARPDGSVPQSLIDLPPLDPPTLYY